MRVSKRSWHYRLLAKTSGDEVRPTSLCRYFWRVVGRLVIYVGLLALIGLIVSVIVRTIASDPWRALLTIGGVVGGIIVVFGLFFSGLMFNEWNRNREPGLIRSYWRAHKERVCPTLEFTE